MDYGISCLFPNALSIPDVSKTYVRNLYSLIAWKGNHWGCIGDILCDVLGYNVDILWVWYGCVWKWSIPPNNLQQFSREMMINQWILRLPTHHSKGWIRLKTWNQLDEIVWQVWWVISLWRYDPVNLEVNPGKPQGRWPLRWQLVLEWFQPLCSRIQHKMLGKYAVCRKTQCEHCKHNESIPHDLGGYFSMDWFRKITSETPRFHGNMEKKQYFQ